MKVNINCKECLYNHQIERAKQLSNKESIFLHECKELLEQNDYSAPHLSYLFDKTYEKYSSNKHIYTKEKKQFNDLVLDMESEIEEKINHSSDPLKTALRYSQIGNYIDFSALDHVSASSFISLLEQGHKALMDENTYQLFNDKCKHASKFMLLCDNCGEVVLDKLLIKTLKKTYPHLDIYAMVRGGDVTNDATRQDASYVGLDTVCTVVDSGKPVAGCVVELLNEDMKALLYGCDVILSKGQGNYEGMSHSDLNIFYSFLCKCDVFTNRFHVDKLTGMFIYEGD